jgi:uncharacterized protein YecT (DUF1311 family)
MRRFLVVLTLALPVAAAAQHSSFDCARASTAAERRICAEPALAEIDAEIAEDYASALEALAPDPAAVEALRQEQQAFLDAREEIVGALAGREGVDLHRFLTQRRGLLRSIDVPRTGFEGVWANGFGEVLVTERSGGFDVQVEAADWVSARWLCRALGEGRIDGDALVVALEKGWALRLRLDGATLRLEEEREENASTDRPHCGAGGFAEGVYFPATTP